MKKTMKKTIALVLCLLMVVSLAACGGQATTDESSASAEQTETAEPTTEETTQQEESSEPVETEPAFDTSWASNDFEKLIPQPPFDDWNGENNGSNSYRLVRDNSADWNDEDAWDEQCETFHKYVNSLADYGFTMDGQMRGGSQVQAYDAAGNRFTFTDWGSSFEIEMIIKAGGSSAADDAPSLEVPALPEGDWQREQFNDVTYIMTIDDIDYGVIEEYIEILSSENFTIFEISPYSGTYCEYQAEKYVGSSGLIIDIQYGNDGTDCRVAITEK